MRAVLVVVASVVLALGCGSKGGGSGKPKVAVSIFPLYDVTRRVAGDRLDVLLVLPPGKSEHGYDPAPKEIARLEGAKLGLAVGLDMDGWVENILRIADGAKIVRLGDKVQTLAIAVEPISEEEANEHEHEHEHGDVGAPDPHFWLDPQRMLGVIDQIEVELAAVDPAGKEAFAANAKTLKAQLAEVDGTIAARSKAWTKHTIVTFHGSMSYFAKRYGVRIAAVVEPIAGKEPTAAYIAEVLEAVKRGKAVALFTEPQLDKGPGEMIAREAGIPLGELDPVGGVGGRESYEKLLLWNTAQLEKVLR
ncbi:MAG: metal ABC transporter substrate-binding protein [Kofleriaceae bacterium]|nr:metal ABC transporter substrate-binding protein [Kofleriaceae bacterium]